MPQQNVQLTDDQVKALTDAITANYQGMGPSDTFCEVWPQAVPALNALKDILAFVPGVSAFAGPAIGIILAAGNAASKAVCKKVSN